MLPKSLPAKKKSPSPPTPAEPLSALCFEFSGCCISISVLCVYFFYHIESQSFADDTQLQASVPPPNIQSAISALETCLSDIQTWMLENRLKLNNDKTEALLVRSFSKSFWVLKPTTIGCEISFSSSARNLGFYIRDDMSVELHIKNVCRSAYSELRRISTVRHLLSADNKNTCVRLCPL